MTTDEFGADLEHVEVLQRKFDEFQKDMTSQEYRVTEVNDLASKLVLEGHPERETILKKKEVNNYNYLLGFFFFFLLRYILVCTNVHLFYKYLFLGFE